MISKDRETRRLARLAISHILKEETTFEKRLLRSTREVWYFSYLRDHRSLQCAIAASDGDESCGCVE